MSRSLLAAFAMTLLCLPAGSALAQAAAAEDRFANVEVKAHRVRDNVYMLTGAGGNIGVSVGRDGTLIVDDQFAPLSDRITEALNGIDGGAPKLILNTHYHADHTGGNPVFGRTGTVVAHDNVRVRLLDQDGFPTEGLPVLTFSDRVRVHFNDDTLDVIHMPAGHTDGDSVVWFKRANVLHTGDLLFVGGFPYIDIDGGGSVAGVIVNLTQLLEMLPDDVRIIPGHGPIADKDDLREVLTMIRETRTEVMEALRSGKSVDEIVTEGLDPRWAEWGKSFVSEERWIRILARSPSAT